MRERTWTFLRAVVMIMEVLGYSYKLILDYSASPDVAKFSVNVGGSEKQVPLGEVMNKTG